MLSFRPEGGWRFATTTRKANAAVMEDAHGPDR
jgi:hypothetical protein